MSNKIEEKDYTIIYGSNYTLTKEDNGLTLEEAKIIYQNQTYSLRYILTANGSVWIKDKHNQSGLLIAGGFALCAVGFVRPGVAIMIDGVLMNLDVEGPPPNDILYYYPIWDPDNT